MLNKLLEHHILANLTFLLVMVLGWSAYFQLPREQDPSINFNWVEIWTYWPGSSAVDIEKRVTEPLEEGLKRVRDIRYVSSTSRENASTILVRFEELDRDEFNDRMADLRREVNAKREDLPEEAEQSEIWEVTSANAFPMATVVAVGESGGTDLQRAAQRISEDLERLDGVDNVLTAGAADPELHVEFLPERLIGLGVSPVDLADSVSAYFRDLAAGKLTIGDQKWLVRLVGTSSDPTVLEQFPIVTAAGEVPLRAVAQVRSGLEDPQELVRYHGRPAVMFSVSKREKANNLELLAGIRSYIDAQNRLTPSTGISLSLMDDQTAATRSAIEIMEQNALIGLLLVVCAVGLFLGWRIALAASISIPFVLAGTFLAVLLLGETLNTTVLLAVVISLGMLVDDSVVVVEAMHFHLGRGVKPLRAAQLALQDVALPVSTAVFTTIAAFLPLILMPGVLGDYMRVVPVVVTLALLLSLVEAFWMLPSHTAKIHAQASGHTGQWRRRILGAAKRRFARVLIGAMRRPRTSLSAAVALLVAALLVVGLGVIKIDFFATDLYRLFYVNVGMPPGTSLEKTIETVTRVEQVVAARLGDDVRGTVSYAGQQLTDKELLVGEALGQVFVSLHPATEHSPDVDESIELVRRELLAVPGPSDISFVRRSTGPPTTKPISIKVRGDDIDEIRAATDAVKSILQGISGVTEITDDALDGGNELLLRLNPDAITRAGLHPQNVTRFLRLFATGEQVADMQFQGETLSVRVRARYASLRDIDEFLNHPISLPDGGEIALGELVLVDHQKTEGNIRHQDFRRAITVEAEIDPEVIDTLRANASVQSGWSDLAAAYPGVSLAFSGELDDIQESLGAMSLLFTFGAGLIYMILGAQFKSYVQPLIVLTAVPMAFVGVVSGLWVSGNPLSLFTLYGVVALAGIAANDAIVLIDTANKNRLRNGSVAVAVAMAARRRFLPIIITSTTTIAGLFSLAVGLGGRSMMWGPVATAIVWGLAFSTLLTLFVVPVLYMVALRRASEEQLAQGGVALPRPIDLSGGARLLRALTRLLGGGGGPGSELDALLADADARSLYADGVAAMHAGDLETPIRCFEQLVRRYPDSPDLNLLAAQANTRLMQIRGWDIGYAARARRYLSRARALRPADVRIAGILRALDDVEEAVPPEERAG